MPHGPWRARVLRWPGLVTSAALVATGRLTTLIGTGIKPAAAADDSRHPGIHLIPLDASLSERGVYPPGIQSATSTAPARWPPCTSPASSPATSSLCREAKRGLAGAKLPGERICVRPRGRARDTGRRRYPARISSRQHLRDPEGLGGNLGHGDSLQEDHPDERECCVIMHIWQREGDG